MIVVADTSPLNYLILIDQIAILQVLYGRILIPQAVYDELLSPKTSTRVRAWSSDPPGWLEILSPSAAIILPIAKLDRGETEAIALAEELHADWLLIDEAAGREQANRRGIQIIGTLGILREGHQARLLDLRTAIDRLTAAGFRVHPALVERLLDSV